MNLWWVFVTVGILLMAMEVITPGFIIMWFGLATIVAAIPVYFGALDIGS
jgi:membrane protein implicated in regulation of membrane protease activity